MCSHGLRNVSSWFAACVLMDVACVFIFNACVLILYACVLMVCCACHVLYVHTGTRIRIGDQEHCLQRYVKYRVLTIVEKVTEAVDGGGEEGPGDKTMEERKVLAMDDQFKSDQPHLRVLTTTHPRHPRLSVGGFIR